ncbi:MAG: histidine kinase, partial [bacterium]|nr:histidine kinase [bacterium]
NGEILFGTQGGFIRFVPHLIEGNPFIPPVVITDLLLSYKSVKVGEYGKNGEPVLKTNLRDTKQIRLSHNEKSLSFRFAALNFNKSGKNRYLYKLEGYDNQWIEAGPMRTATYTGLAHGTYVFRVKGSNNDDVWNEESTEIRVIVTPPWWRTSWAFIFYFILGGGILFGLNRWQ